MLKLKFKILFLAVVAFTTALFLNISTVFANEKSLTIVVGDKKYIFYSYEIGYYNGEYFLKNAKEVVNGIYLDSIIRPVDSQVVFQQDGEFYLTESKNGKEILKEQLLNDVSYALNNENTTVNAKFVTVKPNLTKTELLKNTQLRSAFTTYFPYSSSERKHNIRLATSKINGTKIPPNKGFSFNQTVGARTEENGFKTAKIILDGSFVDGVGGGVCQVSTTLYNSAILSGLTISERHSHSLAVSYVEPSFDAMVNSTASDFKFINNTDSDLYISAFADEEKVTFKIYGSKLNERYERVSVITNTIIPEESLEIEDGTIPFGEKIIAESPKNGIESEGFLIKYVNGVRVSTLKIRKDKYKAVRGKILVGTMLEPTI